MHRILAAILLLLAVLLPAAEATSAPCGTLARTASGSGQDWAEPGGREGHMGLQYSLQTNCTSPTNPCLPGVANAQFAASATPAGIKVRFEPNPAPTSGSAATTTLILAADSTAPNYTQWPVDLSVRCGDDTATLRLALLVGAPWAVAARLLNGSADLEGIHWTIELKGLGSSKTFTTVEVVPRPITVDGRSLRWTHPDWIDLGQEGSTSHAPLVRTITIVTDGPRTGVDYSVELRPSLNGLNDSTGPPITLELPIQSFDGSSTPAPAATAAIAALALARMRRRKD